MKTLSAVSIAVLLAYSCVLFLGAPALAQSNGYMTGVINGASNDIWTFSPSMNAVTAQHNMGSTQVGTIVLAKTGSYGYLAEKNQFEVLDLSTFGSVAIIPFAGMDSTSSMALSPDGLTLYVASVNGDALTNGVVSSISTGTFTVTSSVTVGKGIVGMAVDPSGTKVYTLNYYDQTVSVVNAPTLSPSSTLLLPSGVAGIDSIAALKRTGGAHTQLLVGTSLFNRSNSCDNGTQPGEMLVYDAISLALVNTVSISNGCPYAILTPFSDTAFIVTEGNFQAGGNNGTFHTYSAASGSLTRSVQLDCKPNVGATSTNTSHGFAISHQGSGGFITSIDVIDLTTNGPVGHLSGLAQNAVVTGMAVR